MHGRPATNRLIAPWARDGLSVEQERVLLAVLALISTLNLVQPCWVWPDRDPQPVKTKGDLANWLARWGENRASYVARREVRRAV